MANSTTDLKKFAQSARRQLREQVAARLEQVLTQDTGYLRERESAVNELRQQVALTSKKTVIDRVAYTWFNRLCALRFMDLNRYTRMGTVSPAEGFTQPEILQEAKGGYIDPDLKPFVKFQTVFDLLGGRSPSRDPQQEAYHLLLVGVCNFYSSVMPFLFERIADYTELLMPLDLLSDSSILFNLRQAMTTDACQDVEVIGWLYQYYISERKDEVFEALKKNQKIQAEDIPAATQLFTPHWIVRYLVENSLGRLWLLNHPGSKLAEKMEYYIKPVEAETDFLHISSPEELKICDPACGSGHMLTYAFDLLVAIYEEEGYSPADIPRLILEKNLFGIEIDERAGDLAAFALFMKAHGADKRWFSRSVQPNICVLENVFFQEAELKDYMAAVGQDLFTAPLQETLRQFEQADNFGSLIRPALTDVGYVSQLLESRNLGGDLFLHNVHERVLKVLNMAEYLSPHYHVVVANPPYMGIGGMNDKLKEYVKVNYSNTKTDLGPVFIERNLDLAMKRGLVSMITMHSWMFLSSFEGFRKCLLLLTKISNMIHLGPNAFDSIGGEVVSTTAFILSLTNKKITGNFLKLVDGKNEKEKSSLLKSAIILHADDNTQIFHVSSDSFEKLPSNRIIYWIRNFDIFLHNNLENIYISGGRNKTHNDELFMRRLWEISHNSPNWMPYAKGGSYRKFYGNEEHVVNWSKEAQDLYDSYGGLCNPKYLNKEGITWSLTSSKPSFRLKRSGTLYSSAAPTIFNYALSWDKPVLAFLNSLIVEYLLKALNPTLSTTVGDVLSLPYITPENYQDISCAVDYCIEKYKEDWDTSELSSEFSTSVLLKNQVWNEDLKKSFLNHKNYWNDIVTKTKMVEDKLNNEIIKDYGLQNDIDISINLSDITMFNNPNHRYEIHENNPKRDICYLNDIIIEFISYYIGCIFGRYSLDKPGLVLANQGETLQDYLRQVPEATFMPVEDNVLPIVDGDWFTDDITERFKNFLKVTFGEQHYEDNLAFIEGAIGRDIRSYLLKDFYSQHLKMYKKRPIYWLFSSPKGSFNALIYMHRYNKDTCSVVLRCLRAFRDKLEARMAYLERLSISGSASQSEKVSALKEIEKLKKMLDEIWTYEKDILFPLAAQQIEIDLDDGVKVNYLKFGRALAKIPGLEKKEE